MAIIDLRGAGADFGQSLAKIGEGLGDTFFKTQKQQAEAREAMRKTLLANPEQAARAMRRPGADLDSFRKLNIKDEQMTQMMELFPPTFAEQLENARMEQGNPRRQAEVEALDLNATGAEAVARIPEAEVRNRSANASLRLGLPENTAEAAATDLAFRQATTESDMANLEEYHRYVETLKPEERRVALLSQMNPNFMADIRRLEDRAIQERQFGVQAGMAERQLLLEQQKFSFQQAVAKAAANPTPVELFNMRKGFLSEFQKIEEDLAKEGGTDAGKIEVMAGRYNALMDDYLRIFPNDPITVLNTVERVMGKSAGSYNFTTLVGEEGRTWLTAASIVAGRINWDDVETSGLSLDQKKAIETKVHELQTRSQKTGVENFMEAIMTGLKTFPVTLGGGTLLMPPMLGR